MPTDDRSPGANLLIRVARIVIPWVGLVIVVTTAWTFFTDYRTAVERTAETTSTVEATATTGIPAGQAYVVVLSDGLNLRAEPSTTSAVLSVLKADQNMVFIEETTGWYHVRDTGGTEGWVAAGGRYTRLVQP